MATSPWATAPFSVAAPPFTNTYLRPGNLALSQGNATVCKDIPPFVIVIVKCLNHLAALNGIGLKRAGLESTAIRVRELREAYGLRFRSQFNLSQALDEAAEREWTSPETQRQRFLEFLASESPRGIDPPRLTSR